MSLLIAFDSRRFMSVHCAWGSVIAVLWARQAFIHVTIEPQVKKQNESIVLSSIIIIITLGGKNCIEPRVKKQKKSVVLPIITVIIILHCGSPGFLFQLRATITHLHILFVYVTRLSIHRFEIKCFGNYFYSYLANQRLPMVVCTAVFMAAVVRRLELKHIDIDT